MKQRQGFGLQCAQPSTWPRPSAFITDVRAFYPIRRRPPAGRTDSRNDGLTGSAHARCALLSAFSQIPTSSWRLRSVVGGGASEQRRVSEPRRIVPDIRLLKGRLPAGGWRIVTESHSPVRFGHDATQARTASSLSSLHIRSTSPRRVPPQLGTNETSMLSSCQDLRLETLSSTVGLFGVRALIRSPSWTYFSK